MAGLLILLVGLGILELTGTTRLTAALRGLLRQPGPTRDATTAMHASQGMSVGQTASVSPSDEHSGLATPFDAAALRKLLPYAGFQQEMAKIRSGLSAVQWYAVEEDQVAEPPDLLQGMRARLDALERELDGGRWERPSGALAAISAQIHRYIEENNAQPSMDSSSLDELLSIIGEQLDALEVNLDASWP